MKCVDVPQYWVASVAPRHLGCPRAAWETNVVLLRSFHKARKTYNFLDWFTVVLPMVGWLRTYKYKQYLLVGAPYSPDHLHGYNSR